MNRTALILCFLVLVPVRAQDQDNADVQQELEAQYKRLAEAHDNKDLKTIVALKTADFHAIFPDGKTD